MADPIAQLCQIIAEQLRENPEVSEAELVAQLEGAIDANSELASTLKTNQRMLQISRDEARGFQTLVEGGIANIGTHYHLPRERFEPILKVILQKLQFSRAEPIDFQFYLQSIIDNQDYLERQRCYVPTIVEGRKQLPQLQVQTEQLNILGGLRKYASEHVVLVGKPGSGKSTALQQMLWEEAQKALTVIKSGRSDFKIPVLIELRDRKEEAIVNRIHEKLRRRTALAIEKLEELLLEGRFLLLLDGLNEIPTSTIWSKLREFQDDLDFRKNPRIFTTRELGAEVEFGLETKFTMLPLTESQTRVFVENRLGERAEILLHQLKDRLRELAKTPLLLKMLCDVVEESPNRNLPVNRGELFRQEFARRYQAFKSKRGYVSENSRRLTERLLQQLAFEMAQGYSSTNLKLQISKDQAKLLRI